MTTEVLDRESSTPLYVQLADILRAKIERGEWKPNHRIPSENDLNKMYGISRMTARQVLAQLVNEDLLFRVQGKGTFVAPRKIATRSPAYKGIREQLEQMGYQTETELLVNELVPAGAQVTRHLPGAERVHHLLRLRRVEGEPISLHESFVPEHLAPTLPEHDAASQQLCVILEEHFDLRMSKVTESLESVRASSQESRLLGVSRNAPLLLLQQSIRNPDGVPFEYSRIVFRGDRIRLEFEYDL